MEFIIITFIAIIYFVYIGIIYHKMTAFTNKQKLVHIVCSIIVLYIFTSILVLFAIKQVPGSEKEIAIMRRIVTVLFTPINGIVFVPTLIGIWNRLKNEEITKEQAKKKIVIFAGFAIILIILEVIFINQNFKLKQ